jgi:arabinan endo-1,5-alpha-L-arabinosidase
VTGYPHHAPARPSAPERRGSGAGEGGAPRPLPRRATRGSRWVRRLARSARSAGGAAAVLAVWLAAPAAGLAQQAQADPRAHDPVMIREGGTFYLFATGRGIAVWSSSDLQTWTAQPPVFAEAPAWASQVAPGFRNHIWAPDIYPHDGRYYLYYSVSAFGRNTSAIGVATNTTLDPGAPGFRWVDHGIVVRSVPGRDLWNAIDPHVTHDHLGRPWMSFGSYWGGLKLVRLAESLTALAEPQEWHTIAARHRNWKLDDRYAGDPMNGAIEAPFIFRKDGYYYLFASWDRCCSGSDSNYKVVVGRSRDITGPYLDREGEDMRFGGGSLVVAGNARWAGVGHNSAYSFDGKDYLVFHGYDRTEEGRVRLIVREIEWDRGGWPSLELP